MLFERQESLSEQIAAVTRRFRAIRFWWALAAITMLASLAGLAMLDRVTAGQLNGAEVAIAVCVATLAGAVAAFVWGQMSYRNPRFIATRIEARFPGLQQRLLTALSLPAESEGQGLGYLQRRVISDAYRHSSAHRWTDAVPARAAWLSRLTGGVSLIALAAITGLLLFSNPNAQPGSLNSRSEALSIVVEPGDTEVERGSGLVISARFASLGELPPEVRLRSVTNAPGGGAPLVPSLVAMTQSLDDPVFSSYVASIDRPFDYEIESSDWQSDRFRVTVFEYPDLVRADAFMTFPDFARMEPKRVEDTVRISAVEGTMVQWTLTLNKPGISPMVRDADNEVIGAGIVTVGPNQFRFETVVHKSQRWSVDLVDEKGRKNKHPITLDARAIPNRPVELKLVSGGDLVASPIEELLLAATVQDDFGILRTGISLSFAGGKSDDIIIAETVERNEKKSVDYVVDLESLGAEPDQLLAYHFWAEDVVAQGETRRTQSDMYFVEVRPFDEIFREGEAPAGGQAPPQQPSGSQATEELLELQKQIIAATWKILRGSSSRSLADSFATDTGLVLESQQQALIQAQEMAAELEDDRAKEIVATLTDHMQTAIEALRQAGANEALETLNSALTSEQAAYASLLKLRAHEFQVSRSQQQQGQQSGGASAQRRQQQLDQLELKADENRYETQSQAADPSANENESENRQILNRLRELAQRQEDINRQLTQLQSALESAKTEEEKEEVRRELKRLREQEQEQLREADELADLVQQSEQSEAINEQAGALEQTRENIRQASDALEENEASKALASGTRAERELDELSDEFRKLAAGEFDDKLREMRSEARELEQSQEKIGETMEQLTSENSVGLRSGGDREAIQKTLQEQHEKVQRLLEEVQSTVEDAEPSEPLLAQSLYDTYRNAQQSQLERKLSDSGELLRRGLDPQAQQLQQSAVQDTSRLRQDLEKAAESVLGDEQKSLERALSQLEQLDQSLQQEMRTARGETSKPAAGESAEGQTPPSSAKSQADVDPQPGGQQPGGQQPREQQPSEPTASQQAGQGGQPDGQPRQDGEPSGGSPSSDGPGSGMIQQLNGGPVTGASPLTGNGFREWSDGLRDVEELVSDPVLRSEAAAIRDRAREMRIELRRHAQQPQWELVESMLAKPLRELKMRVSEELMKKSSEQSATVPMDRDPVPDQFSGAVKRYYENLGSGR